ncbi:hypothetical protein [Actinomadura rudentiformis]|uniref:Uncharacterized protein n=1 Tax=Actinomadura rudentiformis TaxID=359158 RepID=A0A6H9YL45_9ACTN|nr:hypothetical protein [Actinomadura rudentiformis]KAB2337900.1 hypothetical protein F8566_49330 [Actinomadura rudentiformis]
MRKATPLPRELKATDVIEAIQARHQEDPQLATHPAPEDLMAFAAWALDHRDALPRSEAQADVLDAIRLIRMAQHQLDRLMLRALLTAKADGIKTPRLSEATGIHSRQGTHDRIKALTREVAAARLAVPADAVEDVAPTPDVALTHLKAVAHKLLEEWEDLTTNEDADEWAEGIELTMRSSEFTDLTAASLSVQLRCAIDQIVELAGTLGVPPARTPEAQAALEAARTL